MLLNYLDEVTGKEFDILIKIECRCHEMLVIPVNLKLIFSQMK